MNKNIFRNCLNWLSLFTLFIAILFTSCSSSKSFSNTIKTPSGSVYLDLLPSTATHMVVEKLSDHHFRIETTASDPYVSTSSLTKVNASEDVVLTFEYKSEKNLDFMEVFFADPISLDRTFRKGPIPASSSWNSWSMVLKKSLYETGWGNIGQYLRLDFGNDKGYIMEIRNIHFRAMNQDEINQEKQEQEKDKQIQQFDERLKEYLSHDYTSTITNVEITAENVIVSGNCENGEGYKLYEIPPYADVTDVKTLNLCKSIATSSFTEVLDRYILQDGLLYDRLLSKWVLVQERASGNVIVSHARYPDHIVAAHAFPREQPRSKKGLGDYQDNEIMTQDLDDLGITSVTVNFRITTFMYSSAGGNRIAHEYCGKTYYFDRAHIERLDKALLTCAEKDIMVSAVILINGVTESVDPIIGRLLQHPDFSSQGRYSMPNMSTFESVHTYAAVLDFLASRYTRVDGQYGRVHRWIMHNETDYAIEWTNMGENKPVNVFMDAYVKSLRMANNIVRKYDTNGEVMVSHTHAWAEIAIDNTYATLDMLNILNNYCSVEGDFRWGLALHCYPQDMLEPKTWLDAKASYSSTSAIVTYKNLEVLDHWAKQTVNKYKGIEKRTIHLSENGTNSRGYSVEQMSEQAAGFAWGWKKIEALDGIDAHQWHNWADHKDELEQFGVRLGLRKSFQDNYEPKEIWWAYQAAGSDHEDEFFSKYLTIIGIDNWDIIKPIN